MELTHLRPMSFGEILDSAFSLYRRHFVPLFTTAAIPLLLTAVGGVAFAGATMLSLQGDSPSFGAFAALIPFILLAIVVNLAMWGALTRQTGQAWTGAPVTVGDGYRSGFRAILPMIGAAIMIYLVMALVVFVAAIVIALVGGGAAALASGGSGSAMVAGSVAVVLGIAAFVAVIALLASYFAVLPAIVMEGAGPIEAMRRSMQLARGARMRIIGVLLVVFLIVALPLIGVFLLTGMVTGFAEVTPGATPSMSALLLRQAVSAVVGALTTPFQIAALVLLYYDRRVRSEALDVQMATDALAPFPR